MNMSTVCRGVVLAGIVFSAMRDAHAQVGTPQGQGTQQQLSEHFPSAAEIMASHDAEAAQYIAARAARLKRRRIDLYKHLERDSETLQGLVAKLNADLKTPAGTLPTQQQAQLAVQDARKIQKISGEIYKRMVE